MAKFFFRSFFWSYFLTHTNRLASEERTKKILSAVRDGLHKLSDMKSAETTADGVPAREPGLSSFYNHVEEIITTDDWSDDDVCVKGVMEEIQVSVQKLARPVRTLESKHWFHQLIDWLITNPTIDWLIDWLIMNRTIDRLIDWLIMNRTIDWLIDWLSDRVS